MSPEEVSLREYFERLLAEHEKAHQQEADARTSALDSLNDRLTGMNEFRTSLNDILNNTISRDLYDERHGALETEILRVRDEAKVDRDAVREVHTRDVEALRAWQSRATGIFLVLVPLAGVIGAVVLKVFGV